MPQQSRLSHLAGARNQDHRELPAGGCERPAESSLDVHRKPRPICNGVALWTMNSPVQACCLSCFLEDRDFSSPFEGGIPPKGIRGRQASKFDIQLRSIDTIRPCENNPRQNDAAVDAVVESIRQFSFRQPIEVDADGVISAGHTVSVKLRWAHFRSQRFVRNDVNHSSSRGVLRR